HRQRVRIEGGVRVQREDSAGVWLDRDHSAAASAEGALRGFLRLGVDRQLDGGTGIAAPGDGGEQAVQELRVRLAHQVAVQARLQAGVALVEGEVAGDVRVAAAFWVFALVA